VARLRDRASTAAAPPLDDARYAAWRLRALWWWLLRPELTTPAGELREKLRPIAAPIGARERFRDGQEPRTAEQIAQDLAAVEQGIDEAGERESAEAFIRALLNARRRWARPSDFSHYTRGRDHR